MTVLLSVEEAHTLISNALTGSGTLHENAEYFTDAILDTELSGLEGHGFYFKLWILVVQGANQKYTVK